ncbi:peptidoglycan-binding domain-containing protein [Ornithinimicrobium avium]|uniref:Peptidoglycan-binding protein n=1 Tax=Ornithinimicrobium avium TaxID=2283195 RepID=A0A345NR83_9MICO|nr:peptidoglycan-binding protein [Ornithinimicrobium avium]AXH97541.1 peptidoglycan-binding protein [Ornithinimicrobium avium]
MADAVKVSPARRVLGVVLVLLLVAAAAGAGWWASRATLTSQVPEASGEQAAAEVVWAEASSGSVGRSLPLSTTLRQPAVPVAQNALPGVVTSVSTGEVAEGDVVYVVGETPVRVVEADAPFWRDLARGVKGEDVRPLQRLLIEEGHLGGEPDGDFGWNTERAVKAWQKDQGLEQTGVVALGELVAVSDLPAVVQLGEGIVVGRSLGGGEDSVLAPTGEREFVLVVTQEQARLIPAEASVEITFEDHRWTAVIAGSELDEFGSTTFTLTAPGGGEVCGEECGVLPNDAQVTLRSDVVIVPRVEGTTVPAAAVRTRPDGTAYLVTEDGEVEVGVRGSGQGVAVVDGVEPGTRVQVLGGTQGVQPAPAQPEPEPGQGDDSASTQEG